MQYLDTFSTHLHNSKLHTPHTCIFVLLYSLYYSIIVRCRDHAHLPSYFPEYYFCGADLFVSSGWNPPLTTRNSGVGTTFATQVLTLQTACQFELVTTGLHLKQENNELA